MGIVGLFSFSGHGIYEYLLWLLNVGSTLTMRSLLCFQRAGDRSWKTVWAVVQGHALIFYKDRQHALQVTYSTPFKVLIFLNLFLYQRQHSHHFADKVTSISIFSVHRGLFLRITSSPRTTDLVDGDFGENKGNHNSRHPVDV